MQLSGAGGGGWRAVRSGYLVIHVGKHKVSAHLCVICEQQLQVNSRPRQGNCLLEENAGELLGDVQMEQDFLTCPQHKLQSQDV